MLNNFAFIFNVSCLCKLAYERRLRKQPRRYRVVKFHLLPMRAVAARRFPPRLTTTDGVDLSEMCSFDYKSV